MAFHFPHDKLMSELPLPGLVHNVEPGVAVNTPDGDPMDVVEATTTKVDQDFYLYTNRNIGSSPIIGGTFFAWDDQRKHADNIDRDAILKAQPPRNSAETEPDWFTYKTALNMFQNKQALEIENRLDQLLSQMTKPPTLKQDLLSHPELEMNPCIVNLKDKFFSNDAVSVLVSELGQHSIDVHIKRHNWFAQQVRVSTSIVDAVFAKHGISF